MKIIRAEHLGMCFGVRDAIALAKDSASIQPLTILGELVHNESVLRELRRDGIKIEHNPVDVTTPTVMITAHGASEQKIDEVRKLGLNVIEATCPLVHFAHRSLRKLIEEGFYPVIIGKRDHVEVKGMTEDLREFSVVLTEQDIETLPTRNRLGIVSQTTQPIEKVRDLIACVQQRFPRAEVRFADTVCQPTKQRQTAAIDLAMQSDVVIVIGGAHSNNTRELVNTCGRHCARVYHVQMSRDVRSEWLHDAQVVGITAGTSTPDFIIDDVENVIRAIASELSIPVLA